MAMQLWPKRWKWRIVLFTFSVATAVFVFQARDFLQWYRPGEAYYRLRPTSWWALHCQIGRLDVQSFGGGKGSVDFWTYQPVPVEILCGRRDPPGPDQRPWFARITGPQYDWEASRLFTGNPAAVPVLLELLQDT